MERRFKKVLQRSQSVRLGLERSWKERLMDKYGYQKDKEKGGEKTAAGKEVCPKCGSPLSGSPPICPKCGSEPFEKKEE